MSLISGTTIATIVVGQNELFDFHEKRSRTKFLKIKQIIRTSNRRQFANIESLENKFVSPDVFCFPPHTYI